MSESTGLQRETELIDGIRVVRLRGRSQGAFSEKTVDRALLGERLAGGERFFVFNVSGLAVLDSSALGDLLACQKQARLAGGNIRVVLSAGQRKLFRAVKLDALVETFDSEDEALAAARAEAASGAGETR